MSAEFLERVMDAKRRQMSLLTDAEREAVRDAALALRAERVARFRSELLARPTAIIAEFKRHSPSAGDIQAGADPVEIARLYEAGGAAAMSVLTEPEHFKGSLDDLRRVASAVQLPLLRKDFAVDRHQVYEAAIAGAEAVLVIIAGLTDADALKLLDAAHKVHLDALVEVHTAPELRARRGPWRQTHRSQQSQSENPQGRSRNISAPGRVGAARCDPGGRERPAHSRRYRTPPVARDTKLS